MVRHSIPQRLSVVRNKQLLTAADVPAVAIDKQNRSMSRRIAAPKRVSHWAGGEATDPRATAKWYNEQHKHMRRGCQLPNALPKLVPKKSEETKAVSALISDDRSSAVLDVFKHQAWARVFESDVSSLLDNSNPDFAMERTLLEQGADASLYNDVREALPELLVARRRRLTMVYDTWRTNTQLLRKYRRIFMARIIRLNRQRLVRFFERWVDYLIDVRGDVAKGGDVESSFGMSAEDLAAQNRAEMEAVWAEKAAAKAAEKKRQIAERDRERKEAMARKRAAELKAFRDAATSRERELSEARAEAEAEKLREQEVFAERLRKEEAEEYRREVAARAAFRKQQEDAEEEAAKLERASGAMLDVFGDHKAATAARDSLKEPEIIDYVSGELAEQEAQAEAEAEAEAEPEAEAESGAEPEE